MDGVLSRDQWRVQEYLQASASLYQALPYQEEVDLYQCLCSLDGAIASFGMCELGVRQALRQSELLGGGPSIDDIIARYNEAGLASLSDSRQAFAAFRERVAHLAEANPSDADREMLHSRIQTFQKAMKYELASLEFKPEDIVKLNNQLDKVVEVAMEGDALRLLDYIDQRIAALDEVRRSSDRGTAENIPWWKVVAVAAFFGITVWALIRCVWHWYGPRCSTNEGLVYALIAKAAGLGYYLC